MRSVILSIICAAGLLAAPAWAGDTATINLQTANATAAQHVAIVTDQENGAVRIVIDGRTVMSVDSAGLHVEGLVRADGFVNAARPGLPAPPSPPSGGAHP